MERLWALGIMTRVPFWGFYVLCVWCVLKGNPLYGAVLLGTYGLLRALVLLPVSWGLSCSHTPITEWASKSLLQSVACPAGGSRRADAVAPLPCCPRY